MKAAHQYFANTSLQKVLGAWLLVSLLALPGCGGSSSTTVQKNELPSPVAEDIAGEVLVPAPVGQDPTPPSELALLPQVIVNQRQFADPNVLLNLNGSVTASAGATIVKTLWTQVTGPQVRIASPLQLNNEIVMPDVNVATTLEFRLTALDSNGKVNSATVSILVKPVPTFVKVIGGVANETDTAAVFTLRLNAPSSLPVTLSYISQDGTANNGSDYVFTSGQIVFAAGEISKTISVPLIDDGLTESDESFALQVTAIDGETTYASSGKAIIHNGIEALLPQTLQFTTAAPAAVKVNSQYANPVIASPGTGALLYSSANTAIATVDANGLIRALMPGTTTITAIKAGDAIYAAAKASYNLEVNAGNPPFVSIYTGYNAMRNIKAALGEPLSFYGYSIYDDATPTSYNWSSNLDGSLGTGSILYTNTLSQGLHTLTQTAVFNGHETHRGTSLVAVGDLTRSAAIANSIPASCEYLRFENDPLTMVDLYFGGNNYESCENVLTSLTWPSAVIINTLDLHLRTDLPIQNYTVEYWDNNTASWKILTAVSSSTVEIDNGDGSNITQRQAYLAGAITTDQLRILQPAYGSLTELVILGTETGASLPAAEDVNPISLQVGEPLFLSGNAFDKEDGELTPQAQSLVWSSDIDGVLGSGVTLTTTSLQQGMHLIAFSATDSDGNSRSARVPVIVGNVAPLAAVNARSERCWGGNCYYAYNINDNQLSTDPGLYHSWINMGLEFLETGESEWISLEWDTSITTSTIDLYSTQGHIIQAYDIEYLDAQQNWIKVVSVTENTSVHRSHVIAPITTLQLRVTVLKGSVAEPGLGRINELVVFGTKAAPNPPPPLPLPQTIQFTQPQAASIHANAQYANPVNYSLMVGSGAVRYISSNPAIASVDGNGIVSALIPGTAVITAIKAADSVYAAAEASYEVQVLQPIKTALVTIYHREQPVDEISLQLGEPLYLYANVTDEDGAYFEGIIPTWTSDIDGPLEGDWGDFLYAEFNQLSEGKHTITLSITDADGNFMGRKSILVIVENHSSSSSASYLFGY